MKKITWPLVALILGLLTVVTVTVLGVVHSREGLDSNSTPLVVSIVTTAGTVITATIAVFRASAAHDAASRAAEDTSALRNGELPQKFKEAVRELNQESKGDTANAEAG